MNRDRAVVRKPSLRAHRRVLRNPYCDFVTSEIGWATSPIWEVSRQFPRVHGHLYNRAFKSSPGYSTPEGLAVTPIQGIAESCLARGNWIFFGSGPRGTQTNDLSAVPQRGLFPVASKRGRRLFLLADQTQALAMPYLRSSLSRKSCSHTVRTLRALPQVWKFRPGAHFTRAGGGWHHDRPKAPAEFSCVQVRSLPRALFQRLAVPPNRSFHVLPRGPQRLPNLSSRATIDHHSPPISSYIPENKQLRFVTYNSHHCHRAFNHAALRFFCCNQR